MTLFENAVKRFRERRMRRFVQDLGITPDTRLLDVGGTLYNWSLSPVRPKITILNLFGPDTPLPAAVNWVLGDGCALPFPDSSFDIVFSNSVIEHLGTQARQQEFAAEVARVGKRYFVQTPNRWFPVETHLLNPLVHYFPKRVQAVFLRRWTVWAALTGVRGDPKRAYVEHYLRDVRLLDRTALQQLFPRATVVRERFLGFTKSLLAVKR